MNYPLLNGSGKLAKSAMYATNFNLVFQLLSSSNSSHTSVFWIKSLDVRPVMRHSTPFSVSLSNTILTPRSKDFVIAWVLKDYTSQTLDLLSPDSYREYGCLCNLHQRQLNGLYLAWPSLWELLLPLAKRLLKHDIQIWKVSRRNHSITGPTSAPQWLSATFWYDSRLLRICSKPFKEAIGTCPIVSLGMLVNFTDQWMSDTILV